MKTDELKILEFLYQETLIRFLVNPLEKNVMVNLLDLSKITKVNVYDYLKSESFDKHNKALKKQIEQFPPHKDDEIILIESSNEIYVHTLIALDFINENHALNIWFWDKRDCLMKEYFTKD